MDKGKGVDPLERGPPQSQSPGSQEAKSGAQSQQGSFESSDVPECIMQMKSSFMHPNQDFDDEFFGRSSSTSVYFGGSPSLQDSQTEFNSFMNSISRVLENNSYKDHILQDMDRLFRHLPSDGNRRRTLHPENGDDETGDDLSDNNSSGYDSMPDLISISDSDDNRRRFRDLDIDSDDADSMPDLEPIDDDAMAGPIGRQAVDESLLDSEDEAESRICWADNDHARLPAASDSSSDEAEAELADDEGEADDIMNEESLPICRNSTRSTNLKRKRSQEDSTSSPSSSSSQTNSELAMHRVTTLDTATFANMQARFESELNNRAISREPPNRTDHLSWWWHTPSSLDLGPRFPRSHTLDQNSVQRHHRSYMPLLRHGQFDWPRDLTTYFIRQEASADTGAITSGDSTQRIEGDVDT